MGPILSPEMRMRLAPLAVVAALGGAGCANTDPNINAGPETTVAAATTTTEATTTTVADNSLTDELNESQRQEVADQTNQFAEDYEADDINMGEDDINWEDNFYEAGVTALNAGLEGLIGDGDKVLETPEEVGEFLTSDTDAGEGARLRVAAAFQDAGMPEKVYDALTGKCYIPIQINEEGILNDTTYMVNGRVVPLAGDRALAKGDVLWLCFVKKAPDADGVEHMQFIAGATVRADCWNASGDNPRLRKLMPGQPKPPSITEGPTPPKDKTPVPRTHDAHPQPGAGGEPERDMNPEDDTDETGYDNEGDVPTLTVPQTTSPNVTVPPSPNTTGAPRPTETSVPVTTQVPRPTTPPPTLGN